MPESTADGAAQLLRYLEDGDWVLGILNILVMVAACLIAGVAGLTGARRLVGK